MGDTARQLQMSLPSRAYARLPWLDSSRQPMCETSRISNLQLGWVTGELKIRRWRFVSNVWSGRRRTSAPWQPFNITRQCQKSTNIPLQFRHLTPASPDPNSKSRNHHDQCLRQMTLVGLLELLQTLTNSALSVSKRQQIGKMS